jgi:hypothetical protein
VDAPRWAADTPLVDLADVWGPAGANLRERLIELSDPR